MRPEHARQVAQLHISGIATGFISSLGPNFVTAMYEAIAASRFGLGLVAEKNGRIVGFVAFTTNITGLYKSSILNRGLLFTLLLAGKMLSVSRLKKAFETLFYPARVQKQSMPKAELLSIVVAPEERRKGLSQKLVREGLTECQRRGIDRIKVLVGADNNPANGLYQKCGFELVGQIENHGVLSNVYVAQTNHFEHP